MPPRIPIPRDIRKEIRIKCRGLCCICFRSGIEIHHIDGDNSNNDFDNLVPLCRNCHDDYSASRGLSGRLTHRELKEVRDRFYNMTPPMDSNVQIRRELRELKMKINRVELNLRSLPNG